MYLPLRHAGGWEEGREQLHSITASLEHKYNFINLEWIQKDLHNFSQPYKGQGGRNLAAQAHMQESKVASVNSSPQGEPASHMQAFLLLLRLVHAAQK